MDPMSVIFSTYNSPRWLEKTLWGMLYQRHPVFEIIVADDGSTDETRVLIDRMRPEFAARRVELHHLWQADDGFRKCRILNKAILASQHDYLVFTDGDCICRSDFLSVHHARRAPGHWLSGSYFKLPMDVSECIGRDDIESGRCFDWNWLRRQGLSRRAKRLKLTRNARLAGWLNRLTPTACNLKGSNASAWRRDLLNVGGFDERMQWGGLDRELGVRLGNAGVVGRHVRYDAICVHLDHARGYKDPSRVRRNLELRLNVEREGIAHTPYGTDTLSAANDGAQHTATWETTSLAAGDSSP